MSPLFRTALVLALLSAVGPFAIDLYLPALPAIEAGLGASVASVQATLTAYFVAFGLSQLIYGPMADRYGRKPPIYIGLTIFGLASLGCALAPSVGWLIAFRFLQGLGGAAMMVVPRAIIRDQYTGTEATKLMALVMLVISVSPMLAPLTGAGLLVLGGWRAIFWAIVLVTAGSFAVAWFLQPETLKPEARVPVNLRNLVKGSRVLFSDPVFMGLTFVGGFGMASFFVFLASASFVYSGQFGLSPTQFGLAFAFNAVGFFGASQVAAPLGMRFGMVPVMRRAVWGFAAATVTLFALALAGVASLPVVMGMLFLGNACLGLVIPTTMVMALDPHGAIAGLASSLGGTLQMVTGGVMIVASAPFFDGTVVPMSGAIALCGVAALAVAQAMMGRVSEPSGEAG